MTDQPNDSWTGAPSPDGPPPTPPRRPGAMRRRAAGLAAIGGVTVGGLIGGYAISHAATSAITLTAATPGASSSASPAPGTHHHHAHGLRGEDLTLVAGVIGVSPSSLQSSLAGGQTIAAVAKAHNVDVNKVITAWVASENQEIDARVSSGKLTQAQATAMKAHTQQRITDAVNGTFHHGHGGPGGWAGRGGHDHDNDARTPGSGSAPQNGGSA